MEPAQCQSEDHEWREWFTLDGRGVVQSRDGIWRCNGRRRRCRQCGLVQDSAEQPAPPGTVWNGEYAEWSDTTYPDEVVNAPSYDPRNPSKTERALQRAGYGAEVSFVLAGETT